MNMSELNIHELETQHGELLPQRETLGFFNFGIIASNWAEAVQALTLQSTNTATATQVILVN
jgi:hypothetical protein